MIIDKKIQSLVASIESSSDNTDNLVRELVNYLAYNCSLPSNEDRYQNDPALQGELEPYPLDSDGYAVAFDPLEDEAAFVDAWRRYGIVVGRRILSPTQCNETIVDIKARFNAISKGQCDLDEPNTWRNMPKDPKGASILSRGFLEIYHDNVLAHIRQNVRAYLHHVLIWGRAELWTSFDRVGVKLPHHEESGALPLHVDQNPNVHPGFKTIQGVLALTDCPMERGTFRGVPGSRKFFAHYAEMAKNGGEYVELDTALPVAAKLESHAQAFPLRAGDLISWDSRTTHANTENISEEMRMVFYMAAGPTREDSPEALAARMDALKTGLGNNVREALMHATKRPRYTDPEMLASVRKSEQLNLLGELLYGTASYRSIAAAPSA